ncbi:MAG: Holliday junction resolvase RuvX [Bdellovibrionales bacterium]|nr:Holliday junction resolvase RuvX [Bdellovibrionales bacterium]
MDKNILSLDVGTVRIGIAVKLAAGTLTLLDAVPRAQNQGLLAVLKLIDEMHIDLVVAGIPLNEDNQEGAQALNIRQFLTRFAKRSDKPIILVDEYGSSQDAKQQLSKHENVIATRKKGTIDSLAASNILQAFLANRGVIGEFKQ